MKGTGWFLATFVLLCACGPSAACLDRCEGIGIERSS